MTRRGTTKFARKIATRVALVRFNFVAFLFTSFVLADFKLDAIAYEEELRDGTRALNEQEGGDDLDEQEDGDALDGDGLDGDEMRDIMLEDEDDDLASQSEGEEPANKRVRNA